LESIPGLLKSLKIRAQVAVRILTIHEPVRPVFAVCFEWWRGKILKHKFKKQGRNKRTIFAFISQRKFLYRKSHKLVSIFINIFKKLTRRIVLLTCPRRTFSPYSLEHTQQTWVRLPQLLHRLHPHHLRFIIIVIIYGLSTLSSSTVYHHFHYQLFFIIIVIVYGLSSLSSSTVYHHCHHLRFTIIVIVYGLSSLSSSTVYHHCHHLRFTIIVIVYGLSSMSSSTVYHHCHHLRFIIIFIINCLSSLLSSSTDYHHHCHRLRFIIIVIIHGLSSLSSSTV
jgi:hypothetical protein